MKKAYKTPTTDVVSISTEQLLDKTSMEVRNQTVNSVNDLNSRGRNSDWDDED